MLSKYQPTKEDLLTDLVLLFAVPLTGFIIGTGLATILVWIL